jgi:hypothetical protein
LKRVLLHLGCILLLLFAQQAALTHGAMHTPKQAPAERGAGDNGKAASHGGICALHGAFAQVLGGMQTPASLNPEWIGLVAEPVIRALGAARTAQLLTPPSHGPPVLL